MARRSIAVLAAALMFGFAAPAQAKLLGQATYKGKTVLVSTGHNNPNKCYYTTDLRSSVPARSKNWVSASWSLCSSLGAVKT